MRVLLIGGAGFIGSAVAAVLAKKHCDIACLVRSTTNTERLDGIRWQRIEGDVRDEAAVLNAMQSCDAVVHLASPSSWNAIDSPELHDTIVTGTRHTLNAARQVGARVVFVSSVAAVAGSNEPRIFDETARFSPNARELPYSAAKQEAEALCRLAAQHGLNVVIVNPCEVYGPGDTQLVTASTLIEFTKGNPVLVCAGGTAVAHVDDVAAAIVSAIERGRSGERYILSGENLTVRQLASLTLSCAGRTTRIVRVPNGVLKALAHIGRALRIPLPFNPKVVPYATRYWFVRADKARRELGASFRPARATLEPTIAWLREKGYVS